MARPSCNEQFLNGQIRRTPHVLRNGVYKLNDALGANAQVISDVHEIIRFKCGRTHYPTLNGCTRYEIAYWLKKIPGDVAYDLGYYLLPAVAALEGDKVPALVVSSMTQSYGAIAQRLVASCQRVQDLISKSIAEEYSQMRQGSSLVLPLVLQADELYQGALAEAAQHAPPRA